jgi:hypothetical protein
MLFKPILLLVEEGVVLNSKSTVSPFFSPVLALSSTLFHVRLFCPWFCYCGTVVHTALVATRFSYSVVNTVKSLRENLPPIVIFGTRPNYEKSSKSSHSRQGPYVFTPRVPGSQTEPSRLSMGPHPNMSNYQHEKGEGNGLFGC